MGFGAAMIGRICDKRTSEFRAKSGRELRPVGRLYTRGSAGCPRTAWFASPRAPGVLAGRMEARSKTPKTVRAPRFPTDNMRRAFIGSFYGQVGREIWDKFFLLYLHLQRPGSHHVLLAAA